MSALPPPRLPFPNPGWAPPPAPIRTPTVQDLMPGVMAVVVSEGPDDYGIARFTAFWIAGDALALGQVRGQVFHANLAQWVHRQTGADWALEGLDDASTEALRVALAAAADR